MISKYNKKREQGFTIIEVLIVLAIAGLILLIVFLAVPALQRNARNTSRKEDAANALAAVNEFFNNNDGQPPATCSGTSTVTWGGTTQTISHSNQGYYNINACKPNAPGTTAGTIYYLNDPASVTAISTAATNDFMDIIVGWTCNSNGNGVTLGSGRSLAAYYQIETGSGSYADVCTGS